MESQSRKEQVSAAVSVCLWGSWPLVYRRDRRETGTTYLICAKVSLCINIEISTIYLPMKVEVVVRFFLDSPIYGYTYSHSSVKRGAPTQLEV